MYLTLPRSQDDARAGVEPNTNAVFISEKSRFYMLFQMTSDLFCCLFSVTVLDTSPVQTNCSNDPWIGSELRTFANLRSTNSNNRLIPVINLRIGYEVVPMAGCYHREYGAILGNAALVICDINIKKQETGHDCKI